MLMAGRPTEAVAVAAVITKQGTPLYWASFAVARRRFTPRFGHTEVASMSETFAAIESSLQEKRVFPPPPHFAAEAKINSLEDYRRLYRESIDDPEQFWGRAAEELFW